MEELLSVGKNQSEKEDSNFEEFYKELLNSQTSNNDKSTNENLKTPRPDVNIVKPTPGLCVKTHKTDGSKVFINICTSSTVPSPKDISEKELLEIVDKYSNDSDEIVDYRIPMSIGEAHTEVDKNDQACVAYDVIINSNFIIKLKDSEIFFGFFMSVVVSGLETKYGIELKRQWVLLRNKKFFGRVEQQFMRKKALIEEFSQNSSTQVTEPKIKQPKYVLVREPEEGHPQFIVAEIELLGIEKAKNVLVDIGEDRLVMNTLPKKFALDIYLPFDIIPEECSCQFDIKSHLLTVNMMVQPLKS